MSAQQDPFDFVVISGGAAGCVLAARLSRHPQVQVLLLEGGSAEGSPAISLSAAWLGLMGSVAVPVTPGRRTTDDLDLNHHGSGGPMRAGADHRLSCQTVPKQWRAADRHAAERAGRKSHWARSQNRPPSKHAAERTAPRTQFSREGSASSLLTNTSARLMIHLPE